MEKKQLKVLLVVEDEKNLQKVIKKRLENCNFRTFTAESVDDALLILGGNNIDAIWLDHYLFGNKSGLDFVEILKGKNNGWEKIPTFVVSNTASPDKVDAYIKEGVTKYYVKSDTVLDRVIDDIKDCLGIEDSEKCYKTP